MAYRALPILSVFGLSMGNQQVGDSGFEPLTSSVSGRRSPPELIARVVLDGPLREAAPGVEPGCRVLQTLA